MVTFEEELVNGYYNLKGYFTIQNLNFPAAKKRRGGKGRGEIDLLAIRVGDVGKVVDAMHIEVSVGSYAFPFIDKSGGADEIKRMLKKFFLNDSDVYTNKLLRNIKCKSQMITSKLDKKSLNRIQNRLIELDVSFSSISEKNNRIYLLGVICNGKKKDIEICPFSTLVSELKGLFIDKKMLTRDFQNQSLAAFQHLVRFSK